MLNGKGFILAVNAGSTSLKVEVFDSVAKSLASVNVEGIGKDGARLVLKGVNGVMENDMMCESHTTAFAAIVEELIGPRKLIASAADVVAVGHRVVHGGTRFTESVVLTDAIIGEVDALSDLAPLHNPPGIACIRAALNMCPDAKNVAVFDTAFHSTIPPYVRSYGLPPMKLNDGLDVRKFGFHGISHKYVSLKASDALGRSVGGLKIVSLHLGGGSSACAIKHGTSRNTSMGMTPSDGLLMSTRSGTVDPGIIIGLLRDGMSVDELDTLINKKSGLLGVSGISGDMREIEKAMAQGSPRATRAFQMFCGRIREYVGRYMAMMGGLDAVVFTGGIGQGSSGVRSITLRDLDCFGIQLDEDKNHTARFDDLTIISASNSRVKVLIVPAHECAMIALETLHCIGER